MKSADHNIRTTLASENDRELWDSYVSNHKDASPYHLYAWKQAVEVAYEHDCYYLLATSGSEENFNRKAVGILPLIHQKIPFTTGVLTSLPFCDIAGPLCDDNRIEHNLISEALSLGKKKDINEIELRSSKSISDLKIGTCHVETRSHKVRMSLDLPENSQVLWKSLKAKLRSQIRKPEKEGLRFEWGGLDQLDDFFKVFSTNMKDLGSPVHSRLLFQAILDFYQDKARLGLVYQGKQPIGCGILLLLKNSVTLPWASTLQKYNRLAPNMMLYWNFLAFAADNGYSQFDFGRSTPGEGTYKFKVQWGAGPKPLYWNYINPSKTKPTGKATLNKDQGKKREIAVSLWKKLPLGVANILGPRIRKYISL